MSSVPYYRDRVHAGEVLAHHLEFLRHAPDLIILGLPRGGVVVAACVAKALGAPLDVLIVRKLSLPQEREVAFGAIASGDVRILLPDYIRHLHITPEQVERITHEQRERLHNDEQHYRGNRPPLQLQDHTVIIVDDGIATGSTIRAAANAVLEASVARLCIAAPVAPRDVIHELRQLTGCAICPIEASVFGSVSQWYDDFQPVSEETVRFLLNNASPLL